MTTTTARDEAIERLRQWLKPGDTVWTILRHCSRGHTRRTIDLIHLTTKYPANVQCASAGEVQVLALSWNAADILGLKHDRDREGLIINGCGEDMGFRLVYELSKALFDDGYALKHKWL